MVLCYDFMTSWRHDENCRKCVSSTRSAETFLSLVSPIHWVDKLQYQKKYSGHVCTVDLVGQDRLTIILTISISVIRCAR